MARTRKRAAPNPFELRSTPRLDLERWRVEVRPLWLEQLAADAAHLVWSRQLFSVLLEELWIDETFAKLVGEPSEIPEERYPESVAVALLLRHSWRPDDLVQAAARIGITSVQGPANANVRRWKPARRRIGGG